jgi:hypothetical protein
MTAGGILAAGSVAVAALSCSVSVLRSDGTVLPLWFQ